MGAIFVGRQPIFSRDLAVIGYELLYRAGPTDRAEVLDGDQATASVLLNSDLDFGLETLVGHHPAYINLTRRFLTGERPLPFDSRQVVLEVLEDVVLDTAVLDGIQRLKAQGYTVALDDFQFHPAAVTALRLADIVKLDVLAFDPDELARQVSQLRPFGVQLLAEKIESYSVFDRCRALGFDAFQGHFLCKPNLVVGRSRASNRSAMLALLAALQDPAATSEQLEKCIVQDPVLTIRLLRFVNSAASGVRREVSSVRQALIVVGTRMVRIWATLILLARADDKPIEAIRIALLRARMCELLALAARQPQPDGYFTVGLFSQLDALLDLPLETVLAELPLSDDVKAALLTEGGFMGDVLRCVRAYERGEWDLLADTPLAGEYARCYVKALQWTQVSLDAALAATDAPDDGRQRIHRGGSRPGGRYAVENDR